MCFYTVLKNMIYFILLIMFRSRYSWKKYSTCFKKIFSQSKNVIISCSIFRQSDEP